VSDAGERDVAAGDADAGEGDADAVATDGGAVEPRDRDLVRELDHDEYNPVGTAIILAIYFGILVLMWVFMYFVEFLGNGPTVFG
jgi:hypothetical protein